MEPKVEEEYESPDFDDSFPQPSPFDDPQYIALAKRLSRAQSYGPNRSSKLSADGDDKLTQVQTLDMSLPVMDPNSPEFDVKVWAEALVRHLQRRDIQQPHVGIVFRNLSITGTSNELQYQATIPSTVTDLLSLQALRSSSSEKHILKNFEGVIHPGEMLVVLGRPGSGCSTFLKSLCGDLQGLRKAKDAVIEYNGLSQEAFKKEFRGEASYNQEQENHFPHLTVQETLQFAASARTPSIPPEGWTRQDTVKFLTTTVMNVFGLSHTKNTKVGNDFVRGVSGGERKRVSIAEMALSGSPFAAWDNSTRGLDSATALNFTRSLRDSTEIFGSAHAVAIYQASQAIYDLFDKAIVLYKGHQIYFGPASQAKAFFEDMGYICPPRQTTGDFLTSVTNPAERQVREGFENKVPRTPEDFEAYWLRSEHRRLLLEEIDRTQDSHNAQDEHEELRGIHKQQQMKHTRPGSPYVISVWMQIAICFKRMWQRIWNDKTSTLSTVFGNVFLALIIGSIFFNTPLSTSSFFSKGSILFFALLLNALSSITEINGLYEQRPIVEKHKRFAFYHPAAEALAGIVLDIPIKFVTAVAFNIVIYFLGGLTYQAGKFFIFFLFVFVTTLSMSAIFRTMAAVSKTISQALAGAGILVLAIVMYTGFTITPPYQHKWFFWLQYLNPVRFAYEALLANELHGEQYACAQIIPPYGTDGYFGCNVAGAVAGQRYVSGDAYIQANYQYSYSHVWRNFGIVVGFTIFFWATYLFATEVNTGSSSTAEFLIYRRGHAPAWLTGGKDEEQGGMETTAAPEKKETVSSSEADDSAQAIAPQRDLFTWRNVTLDITIKGEPRRLLDGVSGYVKPGTLTALMGVSGAGKTTLLDTLAQRMRVGVLSGEMLVNGKPLPAAFQRNVGYVQQQDLHLETTTVREALLFSANLRQPKSTSPAEKAAFVEEVIDMLGMEEFAEAVVGNPGEGLNIEQRKLLTIGVELAAKPDLLLFLDEPTSGLDSQSSWSIMAFLRKLADRGQTVLSTIHQPSAILFEQFDRLLFLAKGGKTVYFGDIGPNCHTMLDYFQRNGARECGPEENPAEYMLEIVGGKQTAGVDWPANWRKSTEAEDVEKELDAIAERMRDTEPHISGASGEFAMPLTSQLYFVTRRVFEQYWRSPTYIYGKFVLGSEYPLDFKTVQLLTFCKSCRLFSWASHTSCRPKPRPACRT